MRKTMFPAIAAAALFVAAPALAGAQATPPPASTPPATQSPTTAPTTAPTQAPTTAPTTAGSQSADHKASAKAQTAKGELVKVDADAKKITIKGTDGVETDFAYSEATEVAGGRDGVAGLATKSGSKVTVHFTSDMGTKTATKIEVAGDKK
jgi:Cu/Ag efflux protein CusF